MSWDYELLEHKWVCEQAFPFDHEYGYSKSYSELLDDALSSDYIIPHYIKYTGCTINLYKDETFLLILTAYMRLKSLEEKLCSLARYLNQCTIELSKDYKLHVEKFETIIWTKLSVLTSKLNLLLIDYTTTQKHDYDAWITICKNIHLECSGQIILYQTYNAAYKRMLHWIIILNNLTTTPDGVGDGQI